MVCSRKYEEAARKIGSHSGTPADTAITDGVQRPSTPLPLPRIHGDVVLALEALGVPAQLSCVLDGAGNSRCAMDCCPSCGAWVDPSTGVCKNPRCQSTGDPVCEAKPWPPTFACTEVAPNR